MSHLRKLPFPIVPVAHAVTKFAWRQTLPDAPRIHAEAILHKIPNELQGGPLSALGTLSAPKGAGIPDQQESAVAQAEPRRRDLRQHQLEALGEGRGFRD